MKAFRIGGQLVSFSMFDVALMTSLPATRKSVEFDAEEVDSKMGRMLRK